MVGVFRWGQRQERKRGTRNGRGVFLDHGSVRGIILRVGNLDDIWVHIQGKGSRNPFGIGVSSRLQCPPDMIRTIHSKGERKHTVEGDR
jgi:hypothetical protein